MNNNNSETSVVIKQEEVDIKPEIVNEVSNNAMNASCPKTEELLNRRPVQIKREKIKILTAQTAKSKPWDCPECPYTCNKMSGLKRHIIFRHTPEDQLHYYECTHDQCDYRAKIKPELLKHIRLKHTKEIKFKCPKCPYSSTRNDTLKHHVIYMHTPEEQLQYFYCHHCTYKAKIKGYLVKHLTNKHGFFGKKFKCKECSYSCTANKDLRSHVLSKHTPDNQIQHYECSLCKYKSKSKIRLRKHLRNIHEKCECDGKVQDICKKCCPKGATITNLIKHNYYSFVTRKKTRFTCKLCGYKGRSKGNLAGHKTLHHGNQKKKKKRDGFRC